MQPTILFFNSLIGALGVITCIQAVPIEVIYAGNTCECPKNLDYEMNMPVPPVPKPNIPSEYDYRVEYPLKAKATVTYSFDFDVEQPMPQSPVPEPKSDIFAKVDRVMALKKDCQATQELPRTCGCFRCALGGRYVLPESSAARITRNSRHPNSLDRTEESSAEMPRSPKIVAIFYKPSKQPIWDVSKTRKKRDISRIFMRPRKNQKRSDRVVKQYNKPLKGIAAGERAFSKETQRPLRSTETVAKSNGLRPLQQLSSFLKLPRLRNKRDIKGEYDLIEKDREQMDLTLPEIIQYMPETLDPNFKRNQCHFGQSCRYAQLHENTSKTGTTTTMTTEPSETTPPLVTTENDKVTTPDTLSTSEPNCLKNEVKEEKQTDNECGSSAHKRRKARNNFDTGCPLIINAYNPTPTAGYTYEPLSNLKATPNTFPTANYAPGMDPVPQQFVGVPYNPYASEIVANESILGAAYTNPIIPQYSNAELDRIISAVIHKHSDFLQATTQRDKALVDPPQEQKEQTIYFLKSLLTDWGDWSRFDENQQQHSHYHHKQQTPIAHSHWRPYQEPDATYERQPST